MTLKLLSSIALASIFILSTAAVEAHSGDQRRGNRGGDNRGSGRGNGSGQNDGSYHGGSHNGGVPVRPGHRPPNYPPPHRPNPTRPPSYPPSYPPNYGETSVRLPINLRMYNGTRIDLTRFVDLNYYRGMRVISVEVGARSVYGNAALDLLVNGYLAQSAFVSQYNQNLSLYVNNVILGYGNSGLVLANRGDVDVYSVTLRLAR